MTGLQSRAEQLLRETYAALTPWHKTQVARHLDRPHFSHYVEGLIEEFTPLAGDRVFGDDQAILGGPGRFRGRRRPHRPQPQVLRVRTDSGEASNLSVLPMWRHEHKVVHEHRKRPVGAQRFQCLGDPGLVVATAANPTPFDPLLRIGLQAVPPGHKL